jgi:hypothetical protein
LYSEVCDVIERNFQRWPLERDTPADPGLGMMHSNSEARAPAARIFEVLGFGANGASTQRQRQAHRTVGQAQAGQEADDTGEEE